MDAATLYEEDIYAWAMDQAAALRRVAAERPDTSNAVDWLNVAEEIGDLGAAQLHAVESALTQLLSHLLLLASTQLSEPKRHWLVETAAFRLNARRRYRNSMRQALDLDELWRDAIDIAQAKLTAWEEVLLSDPPARCPLKLEKLLERGDARELLADFIRALDRVEE